ncbi:NAD(P)/FAD-dependent oxidoreductase [Pelagovum pacificum]|uniref:FAD-binding oxidoreductase n=1 Tax=Pelagovum pacificum TaxID=2588711 RepID=A0A5C5GB68_9RHOB|nr:FAD-binding oxidoreductase [Pelagovum pacificum]QQA42124.1 FAD-binding oxidoreductase [Pelagovum pacificum]TNY31212.1 FAD-binding oxidoreductase [Pelagovum pacificum]
MTDFLVVGGGIAGASAGARLSEFGTVTLLERESSLGYHASGRSAALYEANYGLPTTVALNVASRDELWSREVLSPRGLLLLGKADEAEAFEDERRKMKLETLGRNEALDLVPILAGDVERFAYDSEAWDIDTEKLLRGFAREITDAGGTIVTGATVSGIRRTATGWAVTAGETYEAKVLINAAGAWVDGIARMAGIAPLGVTPYRRSMARIPAPGGHDVSRWPMTFGAGESWYSKPDAGALIVSPCEEHAAEPHDAWADDMVLAEGLARYEAYMTEPVTRMLANWAGLRTFSPDRSLVLGPSPQDRSFVWSACQGGYGFQTSAAASRLVADLVAGRAPELDADVVAALVPDRFEKAFS